MLGSLLFKAPRAHGRGDSRATEALRPDETVFFVHIPKCAGSSFRAVLKRWFGADLMILDSSSPKALRRGLARRPAPPRALAGHFIHGVHEGGAFKPYYLSLVRDPVERFVSLYKHARQTPDHQFHPVAAALDLEGFYEHTQTDDRARSWTVAIQCFFLSGTRSFDAARPVIADRYRLIAPAEDFDRFIADAAVLLGKPAMPAPSRNRRPSDPAVADAALALEPRIRLDHHEDQRLYEHVRSLAPVRPVAGEVRSFRSASAS